MESRRTAGADQMVGIGIGGFTNTPRGDVGMPPGRAN